jgi:ketosteroid isomerase-like protein
VKLIPLNKKAGRTNELSDWPKFRRFATLLHRFCRGLRLSSVGLLPVVLFDVLATPTQADETSDAKLLLQFERQIAQAWVERDVEALQQILADDYALSGAGDSLLNKSQYMAGVDNPDFRTTSATIQGLRIRVYGDVAVATGRATYQGWSRERGKFVRRFRFTDTFIRRDRTWKCVATDASALARK